MPICVLKYSSGLTKILRTAGWQTNITIPTEAPSPDWVFNPNLELANFTPIEYIRFSAYSARPRKNKQGLIYFYRQVD